MPTPTKSYSHLFTDAFIKEIPKTDLHLHLDGSLRLETLIDLAQKQKVSLPSYTETGLKELVFKETYKNLGEYLHGFMYTCGILRNLESLERCAYELAVDNQREGVRYIEVRFAPQLLMDNEHMTMETILESLNKGLARAETEFNQSTEVKNDLAPPFRYGIIVCAMRMFGRNNFSPYYTKFFNVHEYSKPTEVIQMGALELAKGIVKIRDEMGIPIVGFDLAGQESGYPAELFKKSYDFVHKNFVHKTVHAGEAYGAESIFQAITHLHADRLGHCYYLYDTDKIVAPDITNKARYVENLANYIAEKRITVEVCLTSNLQTNPDLKDIKDHSFKKMLQSKISTSLCTDNRLISNTTVSKELRLAVDNFEISTNDLKNIIVYGFKRCFYPGTYNEKRKYTRQTISYLEAIFKKHNIDMEKSL